MADLNTPGVAILLAFIRKVETGRDGPAAYTTVYGHNEGKLAKPLTAMTLDEVISAQASWSKNWRSSAAGGYQFIRATLRGLIQEMALPGSTLFSPSVQDAMGFRLLQRRGLAAYLAGTISTAEFGRRLAMEWASLPVLADTQGQKRHVSRGQSYYAGDGLNKALVSPDAVEKVLAELKRAASTPEPFQPPIPDLPLPEPPSADDDRDGPPAWLLLPFVLLALISAGVLLFFFGG